ncbi:MAG TPA: trehalose-6-phosphate synthase [Dehalococcoidales bacterium]|nr:trehalose-6-phosphate synthase [Dehalococcoidales bacterium]
MSWNKETLCQLVRTKLGKNLFIVVSNREPYVHTMSGGKINCTRPVGGLTEALDPVMRASGGIWIAQGTGDADRKVVDEHDRVAVPPEKPEYTLRRVWLTEEDVAGFYLGFANQALWPLCHVTFTPPVFSDDWWNTYKKVNKIFADAVVDEIGDRQAVVLVQDYHFALLSGYLKERNPDLTVGQFWHIPWPAYEIFRTCPWHEEILVGMLGNDLMGFHIPSFCNNFLEAAELVLGAEVDRKKSAITYRGNTTVVEPFPISVDFDSISGQAETKAVEREMENLSKEFNLEDKYLGIGMDRIDYTKGIPERLMALDKFLEDNPEYRGRVVFIQAGMPSRTRIDAYKEIERRIDDLMKAVNDKYGTDSWQPVIPMTRQLSRETLNALRRLAHFCVVSSLHDGMNMVAKEYVSARVDGDGVLILSKFAGAAVELQDALLINPFAVSELAGKIKEAIEMPEAERRRRMKNMREIVAGNNIYRWGGSMVSRLISIAGGR